MNAELSPETAALVERVMDEFLGAAQWAKNVQRVEAVGPENMGVVEGYAKSFPGVEAKFRAELQALGEEILRANFDGLGKVRDGADHPKVRELLRRAETVRRRYVWYFGGLGHPDFQADYRVWSKMQVLSLDEAVCLSLGIEPAHFSSELLKKMADGSLQRAPSKDQLVSRFIGLRYEQFRRLYESRSTVRMPLSEVRNWILEVDLEVPPEFRRVILLGRKSAANEDKAHGKLVKSLTILVTAIAEQKYGWNPEKNNSAVQNLLRDVDLSGFSISDQTVRVRTRSRIIART